MNIWENLRVCTDSQNQSNRRPRDGATSRYKGVSWDAETQKWRAFIYANKKRIFIGRFLTELEAASAYNAAALKYFGEFARINVLPEAA